MAYIDVIPKESAEGELKEIYEEVVRKRGGLSNVIMIQSLNPESVQRHIDLYMTVMFGQSPLKRYQREMIAVIVSAANNCEYCQIHHGAALNHFWKDDDKVMQLRKDHTNVDLEEGDATLCAYAYHLTKTPWEDDVNQNFIASLKQLGFEDRAILDAFWMLHWWSPILISLIAW
jgi:uncharacterized peroxidase-related enzyme